MECTTLTWKPNEIVFKWSEQHLPNSRIEEDSRSLRNTKLTIEQRRILIEVCNTDLKVRF